MIDMIAMSADGIEVRDGIPQEIRILPLGTVHSRKGTFLVDEESCAMILKEFRDRKLDLVVDYEHQTMLNVQAPAGGWIRELKKGPDAIIAKVEWTEKAKEYLKNREYRYLSPVVRIRKDGRVASIHSVALTNTPAIDGMFAMCSAGLDDFLKEDRKMDLKELAALLGLPENAAEEDIHNALKAAAGQMKSEKAPAAEAAPAAGSVVANSTILGLLELPDDAKTEDVTAKIMYLKAGDLGVKGRLEELEKQMREGTADAAVEQALKDGKITAAQKAWAKGYALKDPQGFKNFAEQAPVAVLQGRMDLKDTPEKPGKMPPERTAVLKNLGISKDDYEKYGNMEAEE